MRTIQENGKVTGIRADKALIRIEGKTEQCEMGCRCCDALTGGPPVVEVPASDLEPGDRVRLEIPRVNPYLSMGLLCGLPIALFIGGYLVGQEIPRASGEGNLALLGAIIGLIIAVLIAWLVNRAVTRGQEPHVHKVG